MRKSIKEAIERELKAARDIADAADTANREISGEERAQIETHMKSAGELNARGKEQDALRAQITELSSGIGDAPSEGASGPTIGGDQGGSGGRKRGGSLGQSFVDSAEYKALLASVPDGRFGEKARVQGQPFAVKNLITGVSDASAGSLLTPQQLGLIDPTYQRPLTVRQLVTPGTTGTDQVEYVRLVSVTNNATSVAEATSSAAPVGDVLNAGGGYKPESAMVFEKATTNVKTIAHWIPATKRALSDAGQVKTLIDAFLLYGLEEELEDQMIAGSGVGELLLGVSATSGIQTQIAPAGAQTWFDTTRMARRKVRIGGRATPTAYVFNPIDWEAIDLLKDDNKRYIGAGPFAMSTPTLWGLPVVESEAIPAGTAYVADWKQAVLWDREQASIQATDAHADFFIRNLVAILAELRAAFGILRPSAFVKITL